MASKRITIKSVIASARKLMNNSGEHWTQLTLAENEHSRSVTVQADDAVKFCSVGGIERTLWEIDSTPTLETGAGIREKALVRVANAILNDRKGRKMLRDADELSTDEPLYAPFLAARKVFNTNQDNYLYTKELWAEDIVVAFNDDLHTTWTDIKRIFTKAEKLR